MLLIEKYFKDSGLAFSEPLADKSGLLSYYCSDAADSNTYIFIYYCWESGKNHPGYYSFKKFFYNHKILVWQPYFKIYLNVFITA